MKKLKTLLCILLSFAMLLGFAACGKNDGAASEDEAATPPSEETAPTQPAADENEDVFEIVIPEVNPNLGLEADSLVLINDVQQVLDRPHQIQPGTKVTICINDVPAYTPWNAAAETWLLTNIYEGLVYRYMGRPDDIRPLIAESYTHSDDRLTWVFQIRKGVKFTDGTVCDAAAIAAAWDYHFEVAPANFNNLNIEIWQASGDYELTVQLSSPCPYFEVGISELYIVSPTAIAEFGVNDNRAAIGTAPYYVVDYHMSNGFTFKANPNYYLYERLPVIETIESKVISDDRTKIEFFYDGKLDVYTTTSSQVYNDLLESGLNITTLQGNGNCVPIFFNVKETPVFEHYEVRKAMNRFIDLDELNATLYEGNGLVQSSIWAVGTLGEVPWPEGFYYDPDEGLALLADAGIAPETIKLKSTINKMAEDLYANIKSQLARVGITFEYEFLGLAASSPKPLWDSSILYGSNGYMNAEPWVPWTFILMPDALIRHIYTELYDHELYDAQCSTYEAMLSAFTWDEMVTHSKNLTDMVQKDYVGMPGVQAPYYMAFNADLKGIVVITESHVLLWNYLYL